VSLAFAGTPSRLGTVRPRRFRPAGSVRPAPLVVFALAAAACTNLLPRGAVTVQPGMAALCVGDSLAFTAQVLDDSGHAVPAPQLVWSSSAPQIVSIDPALGVAHALATGSTRITAAASGVRSAAAQLDVPADLVPEFVPDSVVLAPGDTLTLGTRLRRVSSGPVPAHVPAIAAFDSAVAGLDTAGLLTAKSAGRVVVSLSACGHQGVGAADVFVPPDSVTGLAYLWLSGSKEVRVRLGVRAFNYARTGGQPALEIGDSATRAFAYVDTVALAGIGPLALDSLNSRELGSGLQCQPPRPFATYSDATSVLLPTALFSLRGGSVRVTTFTSRTGFTAVSGRMVFSMRGIVNGQLGPGGGADTLAAVYTFSGPLVTRPGACP
jgi:hypothetical protein